MKPASIEVYFLMNHVLALLLPHDVSSCARQTPLLQTQSYETNRLCVTYRKKTQNKGKGFEEYNTSKERKGNIKRGITVAERA